MGGVSVMSKLVKVDGVWRYNTDSFAKVEGVWRRIVNQYAKVNGVWKRIGEVNDASNAIYGVRVDKNNPNPETRVTYIKDAIGFLPMRGRNYDPFEWGSWKQIYESFKIKPCVLKNGVIQYYLDPNNYTKKEDGSRASFEDEHGDMMIEFGKVIWYKWTDEGSTYTIEISQTQFAGSVKHAFEIERGYNLMNYYPLLLTQILFIIFFKSTDSQRALGLGSTEGKGVESIGSSLSRGIFSGKGSASSGQVMTCFGIESYWGTKGYWIDGVITNGSRNILIGKSNFNSSGSGYTVYNTGLTSNSSGYINSIQGGNDLGFIAKQTSGSNTTYYADYTYMQASRNATFGSAYFADKNNLYLSGVTKLDFWNSTELTGLSNPIEAGRLFYSTTDKFYIGVFLGSVIDSRLRSLPSKRLQKAQPTIEQARAYARANN